MNTAMLHVLADFLRSTLTLIEALLILIWKFEPSEVDHVTALFMALCVLGAAIPTTREWLRLLSRYRKSHLIVMMSPVTDMSHAEIV